MDGVLDEAAWERAARLVGFSQLRARRRAGRPRTRPKCSCGTRPRPSTSASGRTPKRARCAPASPISRPPRCRRRGGDLPRHLPRRTAGDRLRGQPARRPGGRRPRGGHATQGGGFSGLSTGREVPDLSPDFVFDFQRAGSRRRDTRSRCGSRSRASATSRPRQQDWGLNGDPARPEQRARGQLGARQACGHVVPRPGGNAGRDLGPAPRPHPRPQSRGHRESGRCAAAAAGWGYDTGRPEVGGSVRWGVTSNLTLNGTVNPDFSQVEADASQFTYDPRTAIYFPEKRPFFLEGIEQFTTPEQPHLHATGWWRRWGRPS